MKNVDILGLIRRDVLESELVERAGPYNDYTAVILIDDNDERGAGDDELDWAGARTERS
jgi:hypothetical protein